MNTFYRTMYYSFALLFSETCMHRIHLLSLALDLVVECLSILRWMEFLFLRTITPTIRSKTNGKLYQSWAFSFNTIVRSQSLPLRVASVTGKSPQN